MRSVLEFPVSESSSKRVSLESRKGTWVGGVLNIGLEDEVEAPIPDDAEGPAVALETPALLDEMEDVRALITFPKALRDLLMYFASFSLTPFAPVLRTCTVQYVSDRYDMKCATKSIKSERQFQSSITYQHLFRTISLPAKSIRWTLLFIFSPVPFTVYMI